MGTATPASALGGYSKAEEIANAVTHGIAALLSLVGLGVLVYCAAVGSGRAGVIAAAAVFGTAMVFLYTASTLYHAVPNRRAKRILQMLDHGAIYVMIAGSYTPFCLITLRGTTGTVLCAAVWTIAVLGAVLQPVLLRRAEWLNCLLYLLLGWCVVLVMKPLAAALPAAGLWLLAGGGVVYSLGVVFYLWDRIPFNHAIWHLFVLGGTVLQFFSVLFYVLPAR
ncbi:MAG: hemolysin III family protein [Sutterella sp.]|nr:hemolysin III family protein [Sutterella sp.]